MPLNNHRNNLVSPVMMEMFARNLRLQSARRFQLRRQGQVIRQTLLVKLVTSPFMFSILY